MVHQISIWKAAGSPTPSQFRARMGAGKSSETGFSLPRQGARESEDLTSIKRLAGL